MKESRQSLRQTVRHNKELRKSEGLSTYEVIKDTDAAG